jgi:hypothetical protein
MDPPAGSGACLAGTVYAKCGEMRRFGFVKGLLGVAVYERNTENHAGSTHRPATDAHLVINPSHSHNRLSECWYEKILAA